MDHTPSLHEIEESGHYNRAVLISQQKLKYSERLHSELLKLARKKDEDRILFLHTDGQPDRWDEIFKIYTNMDSRQRLVETVTPLNLPGETIQFKHVNYNN